MRLGACASARADPPRCSAGDSQPTQRRAADEARAILLEAVEVKTLPETLRNRVYMRRAAAWNSVAFHQARRGEPAQAAAARALDALAQVNKEELTDDDRRVYADAAMRVNASRWATLPSPAVPRRRRGSCAAASRETCVALVDAKHDTPTRSRAAPTASCEGSAAPNREGSAMAVAVQHTEAWREWMFRKSAGLDRELGHRPP